MFLKSKVHVETWPRTFVYKTVQKRWSTIFLVCYLAGVPIYFGLDPKVQAGFMRNWATRGPVAALQPLVLVAGFMLLGAVLTLPRLKLWCETNQTPNERIEVTPDTLTWRAGTETRILRWSGITSYFKRPSGLWKTTTTFVVEGSEGCIQWRDNIHHLAELMKLTRSFATSAQVRHWTNPEKRRGAMPGEAVFCYREFSWLKVLLLGSLVDIVVILPRLLSGKSTTTAEDAAVALTLFVAPVLWGWWRYFNARISLRPDGIYRATAFGEQFMRWSEVRDAKIVGGGQYTLLRIRGMSTTFWVVPTEEWTEELRETVNARLAPRNSAFDLARP